MTFLKVPLEHVHRVITYQDGVALILTDEAQAQVVHLDAGVLRAILDLLLREGLARTAHAEQTPRPPFLRGARFAEPKAAGATS